MTSIEFGKICRPYNIKYRELFGHVPCPADYLCSQEEYLNALKTAIETGKEIAEFVEKRPPVDYSDTTKRY